MTKKVKPQKTNSDKTPPKKLGGGKYLRVMLEAWKDLTMSQCRLDLLRTLICLDLGLNEVEDYNTALNLKLRSIILKAKGNLKNRGVVRGAMNLKLRDEICEANKYTRIRDKYRREVKKEIMYNKGHTEEIEDFCGKGQVRTNGNLHEKK